MIDVHEKGKGIAGIYSHDIAITKVSTAMVWQKKKDFLLSLLLRRLKEMKITK